MSMTAGLIQILGLTIGRPGKEQGGVGVRGQVQNRVEAGVSNGKGVRPPAGRWPMGNQGVSRSCLILRKQGEKSTQTVLWGSRDLC